LSKIEFNEKKLKELPSTKLPSNPTRDNYLSFVNNLELEIDLREKIKNQYIVLEGELLKLNSKEEQPIEPILEAKTTNYNNLQADVSNAVLKDKIFQKNLNQEKKEYVIRAMYLDQVLKNKESINTSVTAQTTNTISDNGSFQKSVDSLYNITIKQITDQEDKISELKSSMKTAVTFLMNKTTVNKQTTQTKSVIQTNSSKPNPLHQTTANVQNILRQPQVLNHNFKANFAIDNKLMEDRKGFMACPLLQGQRTIRYEENVNGGKHNGVVFTSKKSDVINISQGTVVKVGTTSQNKKYVIIKHDGDYMSVFANLKETYVVENQYAKFDQIIGKANAVNNNDFAIHFQIWQGSQSLNPSRWIKNN